MPSVSAKRRQHPARETSGRASRHVRAPRPALSAAVAALAPLSQADVLALQRTAGNAAVQQVLAQRRRPAVTVQRGRIWKAVKKRITKERGRKTWKPGRQWPEQGLKGRLLERVDKYMIRTAGRGYVDMNKIKANFPAIDGIADGKFRQIKAYLALGASKTDRLLAQRNAVSRIVAQALDLEDKSEIAARDLVRNKGQLLRLLLDINRGRRSTARRTGKAPYTEMKTTKKARRRHQDVLPPDFSTEAKRQLKAFKQDPDGFEFDADALGHSIVKNMVLVVPSDLVGEVKAELKAEKVEMAVEGVAGITSQKIKTWMDRTGYTPTKRGGDDDDDDPDYMS